MSGIADILKKVSAGEELTDDEKVTLKEYDPSGMVSKADADASASSQARAARKEAEATAKTLQTKLDELNAQITADKDAGQSENEQLSSRVETLTKSLTEMQKTLTAEKEDAIAARRSSAIASISVDLPWHKQTVNADYSSFLLNKRLKDLSIDDLSNATVVKPITDALQTELPNLFTAETPGGTGGGAGGGTGGGTGKTEIDGAALLKTAESGSVEDAGKALKEAHAGVKSGDAEVV